MKIQNVLRISPFVFLGPRPGALRPAPETFPINKHRVDFGRSGAAEQRWGVNHDLLVGKKGFQHQDLIGINT
jgi:hypothetical protein